MNRRELINVIAKWAESEPRVRKAILYGSCARNEPSPNDVDVAVQLNSENGDSIGSAGWGWDRRHLQASLQSLLRHRVQLELYDTNDMSEHVRSGIEDDGLVCYAQDAT